MKPEISKIFAALLLCGMAAGAQAAGDVVIAVASTLTTTDPYDANDTLSQAIAKTFYQGLFGFDKDMKLIPVLAESQSVSADGLTYTIKLKTGIKFHDGTPFNAEAVKVNFDRVTNPENKLKRYNLYKNIAKTEAVDATTVRFTLKERFSPFINSLAHPSGVIISPTVFGVWRSVASLMPKRSSNSNISSSIIRESTPSSANGASSVTRSGSTPRRSLRNSRIRPRESMGRDFSRNPMFSKGLPFGCARSAVITRHGLANLLP